MPIIKKLIISTIFILSTSQLFAQEVEKIGKYKDWEVMTIISDSEKVCFAQSKPVLQSPKKKNREARLFVTFRPMDKIFDEISTTSGYDYNLQNSIYAKSGKRKYKFDIAQENFAWIAFFKACFFSSCRSSSICSCDLRLAFFFGLTSVKKGSRIMVTGYNRSGSQTIDHYSLMGFTKAYNSAKKNCS